MLIVRCKVTLTATAFRFVCFEMYLPIGTFTINYNSDNSSSSPVTNSKRIKKIIISKSNMIRFFKQITAGS